MKETTNECKPIETVYFTGISEKDILELFEVYQKKGLAKRLEKIERPWPTSYMYNIYFDNLMWTFCK